MKLLCVGGVLDGQWLDFNGEIYRAVIPQEPVVAPARSAKTPLAADMNMQHYRKMHWYTNGGERQIWVPYEGDDLEAVDKLIENYKKSPVKIIQGMRMKIDSITREAERIVAETPAPMMNHLHDLIFMQNKTIQQLLDLMVKS